MIRSEVHASRDGFAVDIQREDVAIHLSEHARSYPLIADQPGPLVDDQPGWELAIDSVIVSARTLAGFSGGLVFDRSAGEDGQC